MRFITFMAASVLSLTAACDRVDEPAHAVLPSDRAQLSALAAHGSAPAMVRLGQLWEEGADGLPVDPDSATAWFMRASEIGHPEGRFGTARALRARSNDSATLDSVRRLLSQAAADGHAGAANDLAAMDFFGQGLAAPDTLNAFRGWTRAAEQGSPEAMFNLGMLLYDGRAVSRDLDGAYRWWWVAAELGNRAADNNRRAASREISAERIYEVQREARTLLSDVRERRDDWTARWGLFPDSQR